MSKILILLAITNCFAPFSAAQEVNDAPRKEYQIAYCMTLQQMDPATTGNWIKEMSKSPYPVDNYFVVPECQSKGYSPTVKSPMLHLVADDPNGKERSLEVVSLYYIKKRNDVKQFTAALNAKNSLGETLLDYIESLQRRGITSHPDQQPPITRIIKLACRHGATYSKYQELSCPQQE
jgi:hypothetical protein